ncbi:MAG TPA: tripartite tricarboxylate transporter substrate binding protein [Burkholderiales bacterium]|nr:tripartite tricarboxylate transporter substrate binding protein [Burkholderiales bacterium]
MRAHVRLTTSLMLAAAVFPVAAHAQGYPAKPVRILVGFTPGAGIDIAMRLVAPKIADALGQQVVIDNRPGAGGNIAAEIVARAPADGYTLFAGGAPAAISQTLYPKLSYDLLRDFDAVALVASVPNVLVVHPSLPAKSIKELVAIAKARPGQLTYASTGSGSSPHLIAEMLRMYSGIVIVHVPYRGTPPAVTDVVAGQVTFMFANALSVLPQVQSRRLRALAITSAKRSPIAPELPTVAETYPGFESGTWYALAAPAGTPKDIVSRLNDAVTRAVQLPDVRDKFMAQGAELLSGSPQDAAAYFRAEVAKWGKVVKASGARAD